MGGGGGGILGLKPGMSNTGASDGVAGVSGAES